MSHTRIMTAFAQRSERFTTELAALNCGVKPATIRDWVRRGIFSPCAGPPKRPLYWLQDVEAARYAPQAQPPWATRHNRRLTCNDRCATI